MNSLSDKGEFGGWWLTATEIRLGRAAEFTPGTLIFNKRSAKADQFQLALRIGEASLVYCLTQWQGVAHAGDLIDLAPWRDKFWGWDTAPTLEFDLMAGSIEAPDYNYDRGGLLSLGPAGVRLHAIRDRHDLSIRRMTAIDPSTWQDGPLTPQEYPEVWLTAWHLRFKVDEQRSAFISAPILSART